MSYSSNKVWFPEARQRRAFKEILYELRTSPYPRP